MNVVLRAVEGDPGGRRSEIWTCVSSGGADLGLKSFVILSTGEVVGNPKFFHKDEKKLAKAQRRHARKKKGSKNRDKARLKVARIP